MRGGFCFSCQSAYEHVSSQDEIAEFCRRHGYSDEIEESLRRQMDRFPVLQDLQQIKDEKLRAAGLSGLQIRKLRDRIRVDLENSGTPISGKGRKTATKLETIEEDRGLELREYPEQHARGDVPQSLIASDVEQELEFERQQEEIGSQELAGWIHTLGQNDLMASGLTHMAKDSAPKKLLKDQAEREGKVHRSRSLSTEDVLPLLAGLNDGPGGAATRGGRAARLSKEEVQELAAHKQTVLTNFVFEVERRADDRYKATEINNLAAQLRFVTFSFIFRAACGHILE